MPPQPAPPQAEPPQPELTQPSQPGPPHPPQSPVKGLAMAALIVGICAFAVGIIPIGGAVIGVVAVVLGIVALRKRQPKVLALIGAILGGLAIVASIAVTIGIATYVNGAADRAETTVGESQAEQDARDESTEPQDTAPAEYAAALESADIYANRLDMSKAGIYDQLTSEYGEGMSPESAQYAIDNVEADWEANALASAEYYRDEISLSPAEIRDQLSNEFGGHFTVDEVEYAMEHLDD